MNASRPDNEMIFHAARDIPDPDRRREYVREACGGDEARIAHVESLLAAADSPDSLLDRPAAGTPVATIELPTTESPGTVIGPYKLLQQIGEGGMGVVYMAEQERPVRRRVALKIIKPGMDSRQVIARFDAERQALAMMDHVNIARVLDGGATQSGRPYFVMELVHGVPITQYCDDNHLTPRERLELFVPVCQAIQHAHQKGVIHRDVKPSNVMVTLYDGKPAPKVIDFGVAKAIEQRLTERTLFTQFGAMVGTLQYMSPEQAEMSAMGVDTRSDIYSLGVMLYELLTGSTPLSQKRVREAAYGEILRMIKEEEPPKPSARLSDSGEALASISAQRRTEPTKLTKLVRGELDWIVLKTLEKDRNRRYETASGLAADVRRYLNDEPVQACPPSAGYRFKKLMRRHKSPALAFALVLMALGVGLAGLGWLMILPKLTPFVGLALIVGVMGLGRFLEQADQGRRLAERREHEARTAAVAEGMAKQEALDRKREAEKAAVAERLAKEVAQKAEQAARESEADTKAYSEFLVDGVLSVARPEGERGGLGIHVTVRQALEAAQEKISATFHDRPRAEAVARHDLGATFRLIGELQQAEPHLRRAVALRQQVLGPCHEDTLRSQNSLGVLLIDLGQFEEALPLFAETLERQIARLGADHPDTLTTMNNLASGYRDAKKLDLALPLFEQAAAGVAKRHFMHLDARAIFGTLIACHELLKQYDQADEWRKKLATFTPNEPEAKP